MYTASRACYDRTSFSVKTCPYERGMSKRPGSKAGESVIFWNVYAMRTVNIMGSSKRTGNPGGSFWTRPP